MFSFFIFYLLLFQDEAVTEFPLSVMSGIRKAPARIAPVFYVGMFEPL